MLFNSINFLLFFPFVSILYFVIPVKAKHLWLLGASYFFYLCWNPRHVFLMVFVTLLTWSIGLIIEKLKRVNYEHNIWCQKVCIGICCIGNLSLLCFYKYSNFILQNLNAIFLKIGFRIIENPFEFILPVGISFYTFQAIGYVIDVYREKIKPEKSLVKYALFISFFPQLVAGPIERSGNLLAQIRNIPNQGNINYSRITNGLFYMLYGYFLKLVIADRISILVDTVFERWYLYGSIELIIAAMGFALQIYCDFSSYSIIAIGAAQVMGFKLMENFKAPYLAENIKEFWKSWHISLSTWFRDYIYIPLGGNRCSRSRKNCNLMLTFLISGLWHGANWTYIVWGGVHGLYQIVGEWLKPIKNKIYPLIGIKLDSISYRIGCKIVTFILVDIAWIFFRAQSVDSALRIIKNILIRWDPWVISTGVLYNLGLSCYEWCILLIALVVVLIVDAAWRLKNERLDVFVNTQGALVKGLVTIFLIFMIGAFGKYGGEFDAKQFIYFQF